MEPSEPSKESREADMKENTLCRCGRHELAKDDYMLTRKEVAQRWQIQTTRVPMEVQQGLPCLDLTGRERFPLSCLVAYEQQALKIRTNEDREKAAQIIAGAYRVGI